MIDWLSQLEYWHWLTFGFVLLVLEMFVPGAVFMWGGLAALAVGVIHWVFPEMAWQLQLILFSVFSIVSFFVWFYFFKKTGADKGPDITLNQRSAALVGRRATLGEPIENGFGRVQLDDTFWRVEGDDLPAGATIEVVDVAGATLIVKSV